MISQRVIRDIIYPSHCLRAGHRGRLRYLRDFERSQYYDAKRLDDLVQGRLRRLLEHAYAQCPFYSALYRDAGIALECAVTRTGFESLPILEKHHIQEHRDAMVARNWPPGDLIKNVTGGSTGKPLSFFVSADRFESRAAATWRHNRWAGYDIGTRAAELWGAGRDIPKATLKQQLRKWFIDPTIRLNTAHITEAGLASFYEQMIRFKPRILLAYANAAVLFARFVKQTGPMPLTSVITTAEVLDDAGRQTIEDAFECRVFNRYGCREVSVIASECEQHDGLHIMAEGLLVEIVNGNRPCKAGETGEVVITDLLNFAMPLIRYRIGDMATYDPEPCACGRGLPRLKHIAGRVTEFLVGSDGRLVSGAALTIAMVAARPSLGQVQIRQDFRDEVLLRIAPRVGHPPSNEDLAFVETEIRAYLGDGIRVRLEFVEKILSEPSGKFLFSQSRVAQALFERGQFTPRDSL